MKPKIYILTNFSQYLRSFSPILVVGEQLLMMQRAGYEPILITATGFEPPEDSIFARTETKRLSPFSVDGEVVDEQFETDVDKIYEELDSWLEQDAVVITHDLIFLPDYVKLNVATRRLAENRPDIKWLHWVHSATGPQTLIRERAKFGDKYLELLNERFPNSIICYPNAHDIPRVARNFNFEEFDVVEIPHSTNPVEGMEPLVQRLYDEKQLGETEVLVIYPVRLDRGKCPHTLVHLMNGFRQVGVSSHVIICDFQSTGGDKVTYREEIKQLAEEYNVADRVTFLSEFDESAQLEVSHQVILDLFTLSNVFILPSRSETYSLITQEAMLKGNLCLLNYDFPAFRQIYGKNALYRQFDGAEIALDGFDGKTDTVHSDIVSYFTDRMARPIMAWLENDKTLRAKTWVRTKRNPDYIFKNYLEPLLYAGGTND